MTELALVLRRFGVAFGDTVVLSDVNLDVHGPGVTVLMGPAGAGKSTLLRTLAGLNDPQPSFRAWGEARALGKPLGAGPRPALVAQNARLVMASVLDNLILGLADRGRLTLLEQRQLGLDLLARNGLYELSRQLERSVVDLTLGQQRRLAIVRTAASDPQLLCVDEPTAGLEDQEVQTVIDLLRLQAQARAVLVVTHHQQHALALGGRAALLAGGRVLESQETAAFFGAPSTAAARSFVDSGSCSVPSPSASRDSLDPDVEPPPPLPAEASIRGWCGPRGFHWLLPGQLAGMPRPGLVADLEHDLASLKDVGISVIISLEETRTVPEPALSRYGMAGLFFPIDDMAAPALDEAVTHCQLVERLLAHGEVVALHCRAGLGRTGTLLAAQLVWRGAAGLEALEAVRALNPRWVQSQEQIAFLQSFAEQVRGLSNHDATSASLPPRARG